MRLVSKLLQLLPQAAYVTAKDIYRHAWCVVGSACGISPSKLAPRIGEYATITALAGSDIAVPVKSTGAAGRVLFFVGPPGFLQLTAFSLAILRRLEREQYRCDVIVCDRALDGCEAKSIDQSAKTQSSRCAACYRRGANAMGSCNIKFLTISGLGAKPAHGIEADLEALSTEELIAFEVDGLPVGKHGAAGALRYMRRGTLDLHCEHTRAVVARYVRSAIRTALAAQKYVDASKPDRVIMTHGIYSSWGPALDVFRRAGIPVAVFDQSPVFKDRYVTSWNMPSQAYAMGDQATEGLSLPLTSSEQSELQGYLESRRQNSRDRTRFNVVSEESRAETRQKLGIPSEALCAALFSNLLWDGATVGTDICFQNQLDWVMSTIKLFNEMTDRWLIVRPHPAESLRGTHEAVAAVIRAQFRKLPSNVIVMDRSMDFNAYSIYRSVDLGIVNTSTVGLEMSLLRLPIVTVGSGHYRGRGFTSDPGSAEEYAALLRAPRWPGSLTDAQAERAERYAHAFYFRHHMSLPFFKESEDMKAIVEAHMKSEDEELNQNLDDWIAAFRSGSPFLTRRQVAMDLAATR